MVSTKVTAPRAVNQSPPIAAELRALFAALDDEPLITALVGPTRRGPKGHSVRTLWRCFVTKYHMGLPSTRALIRMLQYSPPVAQACGVALDAIPHEATFSRFFAKMSNPKHLPRLKDVSRRLVQRQYDSLPGFGERVALDSTTLKGWSNGGKPVKSDPDAAWSVKTNTHGKNEYVFGYKLHLLVDCEYELPISANVSPGNVHDSKRASNVLSEARFAMGSQFSPRYVMADKGYSSKPLAHLIRRQYAARPVIDINLGHKKLVREFAEAKKTPEWKALYKQRQAVERAFSRLKGQRSLNHITVRGKRKVTAHCYLALIAMQGKILFH